MQKTPQRRNADKLKQLNIYASPDVIDDLVKDLEACKELYTEDELYIFGKYGRTPSISALGRRAILGYLRLKQQSQPKQEQQKARDFFG